jgi:hypothetical protein
MEAGTAGSRHGAARGTRRGPGDGKWPRPAQLLVTVALLPVGAAVVLAAEKDFAFIGSWFDPLMIGLMIVTVIAARAATARSQR